MGATTTVTSQSQALGATIADAPGPWEIGGLIWGIGADRAISPRSPTKLTRREPTMLILRSSPTSPFGRKVKLAAAVLELSDRIEVVAADTNDPEETLRLQNPLGKIPTLILEDGRAFYDSRVIVEYLDALAGGG